MQHIRQIPVITSEASLRLIAQASDEGTRRGIAVSVAVVDPTMTLIAFAEADGATAHSAETSRRKANTSASTVGPPDGWTPTSPLRSRPPQPAR